MSANELASLDRVNKLQSILECPACHKIYMYPMLLSCQHSVCKNCLTSIKVKLKKQVKCPICDHISPLGDIRVDKNKEELIVVCKKKPEEKICEPESVEDYGTAGSVNDVISVTDIPKINFSVALDQVPQCTCDICQEEITWYCHQCRQWLCDACQVRHSKVNSTKRHQCDTAQQLAKQEAMKHLETIQEGVQRLESVFKQLDQEINITKSQGQTAQNESSTIREDWLEKVNQHFDTIDVRVAEFVTERVEVLHRIKQRVEMSHADLNDKIGSLKDFMSQPASVVVTRSKDVVKDCLTYINETHVPRVEYKHTAISVIRGSRWDNENAASLEMQGSHNVYSLPLHQKWTRSESKTKPWKSASSITGSTTTTPRKTGNQKQTAGKSSKQPPGSRPTPLPGNGLQSRLSARTPMPKHIAHAECFKMLTKGKFRMYSKAQLKVKPISIHLIRGNIWCAMGNEIRAWTTDLNPVYFDELDAPRIKHDLLREVQALAELKSGQIAVASGSGLHLLTKAGRYEARIVDEVYTDVCFANDRLYAAMFGLHSRAQLQVFDETKPWERQQVITLPCDGYVTINVQEHVIYTCSATHGVIYVTKHDGDVIKKIGLKRVRGDLGQFNEPRMCHGDLFGAVMISDRENECIQIYGMNDEWEFVNLEKNVKKPGCAVFVKKQLYVLQTEAPFRLLKYL